MDDFKTDVNHPLDWNDQLKDKLWRKPKTKGQSTVSKDVSDHL